MPYLPLTEMSSILLKSSFFIYDLIRLTGPHQAGPHRYVCECLDVFPVCEEGTPRLTSRGQH